MQREEQELGAEVAAMDANVERWAEELVAATSRRRNGAAAAAAKPKKGRSLVALHTCHKMYAGNKAGAHPARRSHDSARRPRVPLYPSPAARKGLTSTKLTDKDVPKEVARYEHYLAEHGGATGGWTEYDHGTFLHHRQKHRAQAPFFQAVAQARAASTC